MSSSKLISNKMSLPELEIFSAVISKKVLSLIANKKEINFNKLKLKKFKKEILEIVHDYEVFKKKKNNQNQKYRNYIFWEIIKKRLKINEISYKSRKQKDKESKVDVIFSDIRQALGFNPSLLFLLIFSNRIKYFILINSLLKKLKKIGNLEEVSGEDRLAIINSLLEKKITIITPLCPDYEHVKIAGNFYKYTFNKLGESIGLIAKRLILIIDEIHKILFEHKIKFIHLLQYGDFESYSSHICQRLKVNEKTFVNRLNHSAKKLKSMTPKNCKVSLIVKELSNKKSWQKQCNNNKKKIKKKYSNSIEFKKKINEIVNSRLDLYSSWFPSFEEKDYLNLVFEQGAEYATMGDLYKKHYSNPFILGFDHPKMKIFYNLNKPFIPVLYNKPSYF